MLVQAVKDPMKTKGARLTTEISLPGRFVVYVPLGEGLGVSRRLEDDERTRLKDILKGLDVKQGGVIVRTAAEGASAEDIERDLDFLQRLWKTIQDRAKKRQRAGARLPGGRAAAARRRATSSPTTSSARWSTTTARTSASSATSRRPRRTWSSGSQRYKEKAPLFEAFGVDDGDPLDASTAASTCRPAAT